MTGLTAAAVDLIRARDAARLLASAGRLTHIDIVNVAEADESYDRARWMAALRDQVGEYAPVGVG